MATLRRERPTGAPADDRPAGTPADARPAKPPADDPAAETPADSGPAHADSVPAASPADEAWGLLYELMTLARRRFLDVAAELDLHPAQAIALVHMTPGTPVPMNELASGLHCDNSNVTGLVDRLEARGIVARQPYVQDRRVKHVVLTEHGEQLRERMHAIGHQAPEAIASLSTADQRSLRDVLRRALGREDENGPLPPGH
ncbi:MAG: MarR family winged helix-turn-helix transcriptional regulator [Solirubrobacteraceae bacterium]